MCSAGLEDTVQGLQIAIVFCYPAMASLMAWALLGERMGWCGVGGFFASLLGVVVIVQPPMLFGSAEWTARHAYGMGLQSMLRFVERRTSHDDIRMTAQLSFRSWIFELPCHRCRWSHMRKLHVPAVYQLDMWCGYLAILRNHFMIIT